MFSYSLILNIRIKNAASEGGNTHDEVLIPNYSLHVFGTFIPFVTENVLNFLSLF